MGESAGIPAINEIVFFLNEYAPDVAAELTKRGSDYETVMQSGLIGGKSGSLPESEKAKGMRIRSEILNVALLEAVSKTDERSIIIQNKLQKLRMLRFISGVASAIGAMGATVSAIIEIRPATILLSVVALASNIANAAATTLILGGKKEADLIDALRTLAQGRSFASLTAAHLTAAASGGIPLAEVPALLKDANAQYREISDALRKSIF